MIRTATAVLVVGLAVVITPLCHTFARADSERRPWMSTALIPDQRADKLVAEMTLDEKLTLVFGYFGTPLPAKNYHPPEGALEGSSGYVPGVPRLGIPPQWQTDASIGVATQRDASVKRERTALPASISTAATWNPELAYRGGEMIGDEARRSGFNVMLAGGVNLMREPRNGRNFEYAGEDPLLAGTIVGAQVAGIQSNHVISTIKHFAMNDQETDRHFGDSVIDPAAARMSDLLAFQIALERSDAAAIMSAYNRVNGTYAGENEWLLTDVLRRDWGFKGYVMSDWGGAHSTAKAVNAGLDQQSGFPFDDEPYFGQLLKTAVRSGVVGEEQVTEMVRRILRSMFAQGLFDHPVHASAIDFAAHAVVTRETAEQGMVLLKNADSILPASPALKRIAVIGGHADKGVLAGGGSSLVYPIGGNAVPDFALPGWPGPVMYYPSSPLAEIRRYVPDATVRFADGADQTFAVRVARESDMVILFATQWAGESFDVSPHLSDNQDQLITAVATANPKTVVVLQTGGPVLMPWVDQVAAILQAWYPGTAGGAAIANILFGHVNPSGRLPATFPRSLEQLPRPSAPSSGTTRYVEGASVGYKWFDANGFEPLFAFGHGLSYTTFANSRLVAAPADGSVAVEFVVENTGRRAGFATPQIYVSAEGWQAQKRLGGWHKVYLEPGATKSVALTVDPRLLATFDTTSNSWVIAPGAYRVMLGTSSKDISETVTVHLPGAKLPASWHPRDSRIKE